MAQTTYLLLDLLEENQSDKHITINEDLVDIDAAVGAIQEEMASNLIKSPGSRASAAVTHTSGNTIAVAAGANSLENKIVLTNLSDKDVVIGVGETLGPTLPTAWDLYLPAGTERVLILHYQVPLYFATIVTGETATVSYKRTQ